MNNTFNVSSYGQSGGITAGQINIGNQQRYLNEEIKGQLLKLFDKNEIVSISSVVSGGIESRTLADEIKLFLDGSGYKTSGIHQFIPAKPFVGIGWNKNNGQHINVGEN